MSHTHIYTVYDDPRESGVVRVCRARIVVTTPRTVEIAQPEGAIAKRAFGKRKHFRKAEGLDYSAGAALATYIAREQRHLDVARSAVESYEKNIKAGFDAMFPAQIGTLGIHQ